MVSNSFSTIVVNDNNALQSALQKAISLGYEVKTGSGMIVPQKLQAKVGETLKGTFTGQAEVRKTRKGDGVYIAHNFTYEGAKYSILAGNEVQPKGTEFEFEITRRVVQNEKGEDVNQFGFQYIGLAVAAARAEASTN